MVIFDVYGRHTVVTTPFASNEYSTYYLLHNFNHQENKSPYTQRIYYIYSGKEESFVCVRRGNLLFFQLEHCNLLKPSLPELVIFQFGFLKRLFLKEGSEIIMAIL